MAVYLPLLILLLLAIYGGVLSESNETLNQQQDNNGTASVENNSTTSAENNGTVTEENNDIAKDEDTTGYIDAKYYADGSCKMLENGQWIPPNADASYGIVDFSQFKCLEDFHRYAMVPQCGDAWFDLKKYCAQVHFYGNKEIAASDVVKGEDNKDVALVLLDGCFKCTKDPSLTEVTLELSYKFPAGSFFTACNEDTKIAYKMTLKKIFADGDGFTMPAVFYHRRCKGLFSHDAVPDKYEDIKLKVTHNCGGSGKFEVDLPNLKISDLPENKVVEFHFLELDLNSGESGKYKGPTEDDAKAKDSVAKSSWDLKPYWQS